MFEQIWVPVLNNIFSDPKFSVTSSGVNHGNTYQNLSIYYKEH